MIARKYQIDFDTTGVVGATDKDPVVTMRKVETFDPARYSGTIAVLQCDWSLYVCTTEIFSMHAAPYGGRIGTRRLHKVTYEVWAAWVDDNSYERRSEREWWVQRRNNAILMLLADLLPVK